MRMSSLTRRLLGSIDYALVEARRRRNFAYLQEHLSAYNRFQPVIDKEATPLCYPYQPAQGSAAALRTVLLQERIYTPTYWPEVALQKAVPHFEAGIPGTFVFLPCDQRLDQQDLDRIISIITK